jgi:hypothetical protein
MRRHHASLLRGGIRAAGPDPEQLHPHWTVPHGRIALVLQCGELPGVAGLLPHCKHNVRGCT